MKWFGLTGLSKYDDILFKNMLTASLFSIALAGFLVAFGAVIGQCSL